MKLLHREWVKGTNIIGLRRLTCKGPSLPKEATVVNVMITRGELSKGGGNRRFRGSKVRT